MPDAWSLRIERKISVGSYEWDRLPACHSSVDRLEAYHTYFPCVVKYSRRQLCRLPVDMAAVSIGSSPVADPEIAARTDPDGRVDLSLPSAGE
ncbi:hypothetical protein Enr13x_08520 [Stieleria neptunia]|uniref:Uncharacterized protein n=1 Tax=Stieleria neptunia TaxID=2527979 RepID=A0A518HJI2_9BACT|nr:hypothetical protein Enr13x_08520 [Stieleria neptunia]